MSNYCLFLLSYLVSKKPKRYTNIQEMQPFLEPSREYHNDEYHETINIEEIRENERSLAEKRAQIYKEYEESAKLDTNPFSS